MRALLITVGSQGDVQPFVALASRLRSEGHDPVLAAPALYQGLAAAAGVAFVPLDLDMTEVGRAVAGRHGLRHLFAFAKAMGQRAGQVLPGAAAGAAAHRPVDIVVHHPVLPIGQHLAEMLGVPAVVAALSPALVPTREFPSAAWPCAIGLPTLLNRPSYRAARYLTGAWCRREIDGWRRGTLGLPRRPGRHDPLGDPSVAVLHAFSPHVVPRPADWPATAHITGYWFTGQEPAWDPPRRLASFLDAGDPPVYLGFGSMPIDSPVTLAQAVTAAARQTGARFIVGSLNPELTRRLAGNGNGNGNRILMVRQVPHDWLFPRTATVVHLDALRPGWRESTFTSCLYRSMPLLTGQSHRAHRQAAAHHFSPRRIEAYRDEMERVAAALLDELDDLGPAVDLVERLALPFASLSLGRLLGISDDEAIRLGQLTRQVSGAFDQFATTRQHARTAAAGAELVDRLTVIVGGRAGASDLLASLAGDGASADEQRLVGSAVLLFAAGVDSPASMVGLGTQLLLGHPDQASLLRRQPALAPRAVAEILRYEPPVQLVARVALEPAELEGRPVPAGSIVFGLIAAANRDPAQFKEPEVFDVTRDQVTSLSFGGGPHYCLGAHLAGMQGEILFPALLRRFPGLRPGRPAARAGRCRARRRRRRPAPGPAGRAWPGCARCGS